MNNFNAVAALLGRPPEREGRPVSLREGDWRGLRGECGSFWSNFLFLAVTTTCSTSTSKVKPD